MPAKPGDAAALVGAVQVVAGDPQAGAGEQHVVGTQPAVREWG